MQLILLLFILSSSVSQNINNNSSIKLLFLGDFDFGESYQENPKYNRGVNIIDEYGFNYMFENIKDLLKNSNLTISNLETPLLPGSHIVLNSMKPYVHWSRGQRTIKYLKKYNISAISLANNHTYDLDYAGFAYTLRELNENKFEYFGGGNNIEEASEPLIKQFALDNDTITIAVLAGFEYRKNYDIKYDFYANEIKSGVNVISVENITTQINEIKNEYKNPYIIFFPHWGKNYSWKTDEQTETAHKVIDAGADLIIGHGAHMMQEVEKYNNKWIIYSIGNSIFNAPGRYNSRKVKPYSVIAELLIKNDGKNKLLKLHPIYTDNLETDYQTRLLDNAELDDCYSLLKSRSTNTRIFKDEFRINIEGDTKYFEIQLN